VFVPAASVAGTATVRVPSLFAFRRVHSVCPGAFCRREKAGIHFASVGSTGTADSDIEARR
jgi:hypothetical protein